MNTITIRRSTFTLLAAAALCFGPFSQAGTTDRTTATIVGAAVGGVVGSVAGNNMESTLLGAAIGGTAGNLIAKNNQKKEVNKAAERYHTQYRHTHHTHAGNHKHSRSSKKWCAQGNCNKYAGNHHHRR